ncbi:MAG: metallophosphoesterase [Actinomycetota bacterium]|nr:metallophosphoesterase [Actinomycetota bacterium]
MFTIAHISDLHIGGRPESVERAERVIAHVMAMAPAPDVLLVTGDIADHGDDEEYATAHRLLSAWTGLLMVGTGNHDVREPFARHLLGTERWGPLDQALDVSAHRLLMLDSLVPAVDGVRQDHGLLAPETLTWLESELGSFDGPTFVCLHHPPTTVGIERADAIQLHNGSELEAVLARHPHVVGVLVGHNHTMCATTFAGRPCLVGGGVVSGVTLDQEPLPHVWLDAPPSLAVHLVGDDGRLTTFWRALA